MNTDPEPAPEGAVVPVGPGNEPPGNWPASAAGRGAWLWYLGLVMALLALGLPHVDAPVRPHHEGTVVYPALLIKHGARPLTDVAIQHPPLTAYVYAAGMGIGGERLAVTRWITLAAVILQALLMAWLMARVTGAWVGASVGLLWAGATQLIEYLFLPWSTHFGLICVLLALREGGAWCDLAAPTHLLRMGVWLGFSLAFRINLGAAALGTLALALAGLSGRSHPASTIPSFATASNRRAPWWRAPGLMLAAAAVTSMVLAALIALHVGSVQSMVRAMDFQRAVAAERSFSLVECLSLDGSGLWTGLLIGVAALGLLGMSHAQSGVAIAGLTLWLITLAFAVSRPSVDGGIDALKLVPGLLGIVLVCLWRWRRERHTTWYRRLVLVAAGACATWSINFPLPGLPQAMWASSGALVAALHALAQSLRGLAPRRRACLWAAALATLLVLVPSRNRTRGDDSSQARVAAGFCAGMRGDPGWVTDEAALRARIQTVVPPHEPVLVWRMLSLLYADLDRPAAGLPVLHFDRFTERMASGPAVMQETLARLQERPPAAVIVDTHQQSDAFPDWYRGTHAPIADWLARRYTTVWSSPNGLFQVLTPGPPPSGEIDLHFRRMLLDFAPAELLQDVARETQEVLRVLAATRQPGRSPVSANGKTGSVQTRDLDQPPSEAASRAARSLTGADRVRALAAVEACLAAYRLVERDTSRLTPQQFESKRRWEAIAADLRAAAEAKHESPN